MTEKVKEFQNEAEVEQLYKDTGREVVVFEGSVYDIGGYKEVHPGGGKIFDDWYGKAIDEPFEEEGHSKAARLIFRDLTLVGYMAGCKKEGPGDTKGLHGTAMESNFDIDYDKPILPQLWNKKDMNVYEYIQWINEPKHLINPVRDLPLFPWTFAEAFSKSPWYCVVILWVPIICYHLSQSQLSYVQTLIGYLIGLFVWTFAEYTLHRWLFHSEVNWMPHNSKIVTAHFLFHGQHHAFPMDKYRLVFPPGMSLTFWFLLVRPPLLAFTPTPWLMAVSAGLQSGYVSYDMIHYWTHHAEVDCSHMKSMKKYHMLHHYRNGDIGFGVSNKFWDYVFGTVIKEA